MSDLNFRKARDRLRTDISNWMPLTVSEIREKDYNDFLTMPPLLLPHEKAWLKSAIDYEKTALVKRRFFPH
jgi:hypothetical protein